MPKRGFFSSPEFANAISFETENEIVIESDLFKESDITKFHLNYREENAVSCPKGIRRPLSIASLGTSPLKYYSIDVEEFVSCGVERYKFSRLMLLGKTAWIFILAPVEVMPDLFFYPQIVFGLPLE